MTNFKLKQEINDCLLYADLISNQGFEPEGEIRLRDMVKFDFLQFIGFLFESDGSTIQPELTFIQEHLGMYFTVEKFLRFKYDRCMGKDFINTPPRSLTYFAKYDLAQKAVSSDKPLNKSRFLVKVYIDLGQAFIDINNADSAGIANLTNYTLMLENYLKQLSLYSSDITASQTSPVNKQPAEEKDETLEALMEELNSLTGLDNVKQDINNLVNLLKVKKMREERGMKQPSISLHLVFSGNPGTGKTTVARLLAKIYKKLGVLKTGQLIEVDRSGLVEGYVGQTAAKTKKVIESALGGVLFIDEAYTLTENKGDNDFGQEAVDTLLKEMEDNRNNLVVIVAGYTDLMENFVESNPGLKSRFNKYIFFADYTGDQLFEIFMGMCRAQDYIPDEEGAAYAKKYLTDRAKQHDENFANAREVRNYIERAISRQASRIVSIKDIDDATLKTLTLIDLKED